MIIFLSFVCWYRTIKVGKTPLNTETIFLQKRDLVQRDLLALGLELFTTLSFGLNNRFYSHTA